MHVSTPSLNVTVLPEIAGTRSPGTRIPTRLSGSAADRTIISPVFGSLRVARNDSTATGRANCSPRKPSTKRPPRISPRSSSRRKAICNSRHLGRLVSRESRVAKDDAIALEQHPAGRFDRAIAIRGLIRVKQSPSARAVTGTRRPPAALPGASFGIDQRAQIVKAIRSDQPTRDQLPQCGLHLGLQAIGAAHDIGEE